MFDFENKHIAIYLSMGIPREVAIIRESKGVLATKQTECWGGNDYSYYIVIDKEMATYLILKGIKLNIEKFPNFMDGFITACPMKMLKYYHKHKWKCSLTKPRRVWQLANSYNKDSMKQIEKSADECVNLRVEKIDNHGVLHGDHRLYDQLIRYIPSTKTGE